MNTHRHRNLAALSALLIALSPGLTGASARVLSDESARDPGIGARAIDTDVLVVGGTPAGVAAAVTAARAGERVRLVSASDDLGGTLTDAMMDQWDLNLAPDGRPVEHGIFDEIYARLGDVFTPRAAARTFAQMIAAEPRISAVYDSVAISARTSDAGGVRRIIAVTFQNERSHATQTLSAPFVIDATDDADVAVLGGAGYDLGRQDSGLDERMQAVTEMFTLDNVDWNALAAAYDVSRDGAGGVVGRRAWGYATLLRGYRASATDVVVRDLNLGELPDGDVTVNAIDVCGIDGLNPRQLLAAKRQTEREAPRLLAFLRPRVPGFAAARIGTFAPNVYVRETRHIAGDERLTTRDVWQSRVPADSVALASYPIDLHPVDATDEPAYAPERHVYGIPFGALVPRGLANVLLASPAISASHLASGSARVIPTTIEEGQADALAVVSAERHAWAFNDFSRDDAAFASILTDVDARAAPLRPRFAHRSGRPSKLG